MANSDDLLKQITLLQAYIESLQEDAKCMTGLKKDCVEFRMRLGQIDREMKKLWSMHDDWITHQEKFKQLSKSMALMKQKHEALKDRLKNYKQIEETYLEFKSQVLKIGIGAIIFLITASICIQVALRYLPT